ncbi:hypothetical protein [Clostridium lacusfryxellense]|uniref:hypothetical protein n=1 Tax=Clostridium lacusfryxellense TaxID=205328 RepID=UPI001C0C5E59|nr:hypothetical protein [Clostridium lacusfryxellense]MBU3113499.1 hypothetical protein [Clostridium lacusfryxellense]
MNKYNLDETKKENSNKNNASNSDVTRMYNMPNMTSGPGDATEEEKNKLKEHSAAHKGTT